MITNSKAFVNSLLVEICKIELLLVIKGNPYHDELGRFSEGPGGDEHKNGVEQAVKELKRQSLSNEKQIIIDKMGRKINEVLGTEHGIGRPVNIDIYEDITLLHSHPTPHAFSYTDITQAARIARAGKLISDIVVGNSFTGDSVIFKVQIEKPWTSLEWNTTILPKLERKDSEFRRELGQQTGERLTQTGVTMHALWSWATTKGPLKGRMTYEVSGNTEMLWNSKKAR